MSRNIKNIVLICLFSLCVFSCSKQNSYLNEYDDPSMSIEKIKQAADNGNTDAELEYLLLNSDIHKIKDIYSWNEEVRNYGKKFLKQLADIASKGNVFAEAIYYMLKEDNARFKKLYDNGNDEIDYLYILYNSDKMQNKEKLLKKLKHLSGKYIFAKYLLALVYQTGYIDDNGNVVLKPNGKKAIKTLKNIIKTSNDKDFGTIEKWLMSYFSTYIYDKKERFSLTIKALAYSKLIDIYFNGMYDVPQNYKKVIKYIKELQKTYYSSVENGNDSIDLQTVDKLINEWFKTIKEFKEKKEITMQTFQVYEDINGKKIIIPTERILFKDNRYYGLLRFKSKKRPTVIINGKNKWDIFFEYNKKEVYVKTNIKSEEKKYGGIFEYINILASFGNKEKNKNLEYYFLIGFLNKYDDRLIFSGR